MGTSLGYLDDKAQRDIALRHLPDSAQPQISKLSEAEKFRAAWASNMIFGYDANCISLEDVVKLPDAVCKAWSQIDMAKLVILEKINLETAKSLDLETCRKISWWPEFAEHDHKMTLDVAKQISDNALFLQLLPEDSNYRFVVYAINEVLDSGKLRSVKDLANLPAEKLQNLATKIETIIANNNEYSRTLTDEDWWNVQRGNLESPAEPLKRDLIQAFESAIDATKGTAPKTNIDGVDGVDKTIADPTKGSIQK